MTKQTTPLTPKKKPNYVELHPYEELLLAIPTSITLLLIVTAIFYQPELVLSALPVSILCIYSLLTIGRQYYSRVFLAIVSILGLFALTQLFSLGSGIIADLSGQYCTGFFSTPTSCAKLSVLLISLAALPASILSVIALIFQVRTPSKLRKKVKNNDKINYV